MTHNSFERVRAAAENLDLNFRETRAGVQASMQTPGHSDRDFATSITYNGDQVLMYCHNGNTEDVLDALGLTYRDLYDNPRETSYTYSDGRQVFRRWRDDFGDMKGFTQRNNKGCTALYGVESLTVDGPVYVVEGEKDVNTARALQEVAVVSQAQGASTGPEKADWTGLSGRDVIIVRDNDDKGHSRAEKVRAYLEAMTPAPSSVQVVDVAVPDDKADLSDHLAAGHGLDELIPVAVEEQPRRRITLIPAASVRTERLDWLIDNWVPRRSLTLLAGREGLGKSTIACGIAAQATRGELNAPPMNVAYLNTEDSRSITVKPRLQAAGADLDRVFFIDVTTEEGGAGALSLPGDTSLLARALVDQGVQLVILDAAKSAMHASLDGYRDDDVRQFLEPLAAMCDEHDMAVIGLAHFGKRESADTGKLLLGSIAWSQIARSVLSVARNEEDGTLVCTNTKGNLAPAQVSREAHIESVTVATDDNKTANVGRIVWGDETNISAADLLVTRDDPDAEERTEAEAWLEDYLRVEGPTARVDVLKAAQRDRVASEPTIKRAFRNIGGKSDTSGFPRRAVWFLPDHVEDFFDPCTNTSDPTDPTGDDQGKQDDPTGPVSLSDHSQECEPTDDPNGETNHPLAPSSRDVLNVLSSEMGMTLNTVKGCFTTKQLVELADGSPRPDDHRAALEKILTDLEHAGLVHRDTNNRYIKTTEGARAA